MPKKEVNILSVLAIIILIATIVTVLVCRPIIITERNYKSVGNNIYYTNDLLNEKAREKEQIIGCYKIISDYIKENYEYSFFVSNFNYGYLSDEDQIIFNINQMQNNTIILKNRYHVVVKNNEVIEFSPFYDDAGFFDKDKSSLTTPTFTVSQIKRTAAKAVKKTSCVNSLIFPFSRGEAYLEYGKDDSLYYKVVFKSGSYAKIDANTGEVIDTYFDDGIVYNR